MFKNTHRPKGKGAPLYHDVQLITKEYVSISPIGTFLFYCGPWTFKLSNHSVSPDSVFSFLIFQFSFSILLSPRSGLFSFTTDHGPSTIKLSNFSLLPPTTDHRLSNHSPFSILHFPNHPLNCRIPSCFNSLQAFIKLTRITGIRKCIFSWNSQVFIVLPFCTFIDFIG